MYKVNIVIPSITTDSRLIRCLDGIQNLNYKNFFVTLVLDDNKNLSKLKKFKFKIKILFLKGANMSTKRNIATKKFNSVFLAIIISVEIIISSPPPQAIPLIAPMIGLFILGSS